MIKAENLCMRYGPVQALDDVNFEVKKGEIIGLLGPNGAGKSTTLKIITTYIYPSSGTAYVAGKNVKDQPIPIRKMIGYLPEQLPLYTDMEVSEYLQFVGKSRGLHGQILEDRLRWVREKCGLKLVYHKIIRELSKGYRQRTALAQALIHDPEIVILDEPTSGLDPHQIIEIRELIKELAKQKTIIFSTHILQEVQAITDRVIIINRGRIVANGTIGELEKSLEQQQCQLVLPKQISESEVIDALKKCDFTAKVEKRKSNEIEYLVTGREEGDMRSSLAKVIKDKKWDFLEMKKKTFSLEELFLKLTEPVKK